MGDRGVERVDYDAELRLQAEALRRAYDIGAGNRVLDVGCGSGASTREAARLASDGWAVGVDSSKEMVDRARALAAAEGLANIAFEHADAQDHPFDPGVFDLVLSRFGTMFFRDPLAAFTNIGRGVRVGGRLLMIVWQSHERNEWSVSIGRALGAATGGSEVQVVESLDPFTLADPATVRGILDAAGFTDVTFREVDRPVFYGRDVAAAVHWVGGFACTRQVLDRLDRTGRERALEGLRELFAAHAREDGVWFDSRAWIVEARRR